MNTEIVERDMPPEFVPLYRACIKKYGLPIEPGQGRLGFDTGRGYVVKLPWNYKGDEHNISEYVRWRHREQFCAEFARCRLTVISGINVLVMEKVTEPAPDFEYPEWTCAIDCQQVGFNRKGQLVAYDYAS